MVNIYQPWNDSEVEIDEKLLRHRACLGSWNIWIDASNTAEYAVKLWKEAKTASNFREAVNKARLFTKGAKFAAKEAENIGSYAPSRDYDPRKKYIELSKQFHL